MKQLKAICYTPCKHDLDCASEPNCKMCHKGQCHCRSCDNHNACQTGHGVIELFNRRCARQKDKSFYCEHCHCLKDEVCIYGRCTARG